MVAALTGAATPPTLYSAVESSELGHLSAFDGFTLVAAVAGASSLAWVRKRRGMGTSLETWFSDALSIGTLMVLFACVVITFLPHMHWLEETVRANGFLVALSFVYCAAVIGNTLRKSIAAAESGVAAK